MRSIIITVFCILFFVLPVEAESVVSRGLVDVAGSQRMLTQRMLRDYVLIGMNISYQNPSGDLKQIMARFEKQLESIASVAATEEIRQGCQVVEKLWQPLKNVLTREPEKVAVKGVLSDIEALLGASDALVSLIEKATGGAVAEVVNTAGRQRMLSQQMAALYMLYFWEVGNEDIFVQFKQVVLEYRKANNFLLTNGQTTSLIREKLNRAAAAFRWFSQVADNPKQRLNPQVVQRNSDILLKQMDKITQMYMDVVERMQ